MKVLLKNSTNVLQLKWMHLFLKPWDKAVMLTPLPEKEKTGLYSRLIDDAIDKRKVINAKGGHTPNYIFLRFFIPINKEMRVYHEEQFGPVVPILF
jgi:glyceraldehyde-3-phosphate dehydrogenase (NADP+)